MSNATKLMYILKFGLKKKTLMRNDTMVTYILKPEFKEDIDVKRSFVNVNFKTWIQIRLGCQSQLC